MANGYAFIDTSHTNSELDVDKRTTDRLYVVYGFKCDLQTLKLIDFILLTYVPGM